MSPKIHPLDTSNAQVDQAATPDKIHAPLEALYSPFKDYWIMKTNDGLAPENPEEGDMPLQVLCRAAIAAESQEGLTSSCICLSPEGSIESAATATMRTRIMRREPCTVQSRYTKQHRGPAVRDFTLPHANNIARAAALTPAMRATSELVEQLGGFVLKPHNLMTSSHVTPEREMVAQPPELLFNTSVPSTPIQSSSSGAVALRIRNALIAEDRRQSGSNGSTLKRQRKEEESDFSSRGSESMCSFDNDHHRSKKHRADCNYDLHISSWMTQKIDFVNRIIEQVDDGINHMDYVEGILLEMISNPSNDLSQKARDVLDACRQELDTDALYESRLFLKDLRHDMIQEGGIVMIQEGGIDRDDLV